jgi:hypothetical protein
VVANGYAHALALCGHGGNLDLALATDAAATDYVRLWRLVHNRLPERDEVGAIVAAIVASAPWTLDQYQAELVGAVARRRVASMCAQP